MKLHPAGLKSIPSVGRNHKINEMVKYTFTVILLLILQTPGLKAQDGPSEENVPETQRVYLSGTGCDRTVDWEFFCTAGRKSGTWTTIAVPSCWEQEGYGEYNYGVYFYGKATDPAIPTEKGMYRYRFDVPGDWQGKKVDIVFEGSMTDTRVKVNGREAGPVHRGGFYRFRYDVTPLLEFGAQNLLEVTVSKESENAGVNLAERRADYWNFGGIFRPVFLEVMPPVRIERVAVDAKADGSFRADLYLGGEIPAGSVVRARLMDMTGKPLGEAFQSPVETGSEHLTLQCHFENVECWTAETPNLYTLSITLMSGDESLHRVIERIGFRTFEIRTGDGFYLNGQRILLKGVNRHSFRPESGRTLSPKLNYDDVKRMKEMNMNTVRMSHYPPDPEFLNACDELGLYVLDELGGWHGRYDTETGKILVEEMVTRDVNHPSILFWDNGNEGGWNTELDPEFSRWDPQGRPVLHPQQDLKGVETMHYRSYGETQEYLRGEDIFFPTEMLHGLYDGGHGAGLYDYWEMMRVHPRCGGGILWDFADQGVVRTDLGDSIDTDGNHGADGILGPHHEKEGSFYTIKEVWSPVWIGVEDLAGDFDGRLPVENRYDFTNLSDCKFHWELGGFWGPTDGKSGHRVLDSGTAASPDVKPHEAGTLELDLPDGWMEADALYLKAADPAGREIWTWSWRIGDHPVPRATIPGSGDEIRWDSAGGYIHIETGRLRITFDLSTGLLDGVEKNGRRISFGRGPRFVAARRGDRTLDGSIDPDAPEGVDRIYREISYPSVLTGLDISGDERELVLSANYFGPISWTRWTISAGGSVRLDYEYRYDGVVELMGIAFDYPESNMESIRWLGEGPYRVWQNRLHGTRLDVWENAYNDAVPAEVFTYPEFKGYFGDWSWASFRTRQGVIRMATPSHDTYLGVYTPRDGRDALLYTLPQTGISVLDVIPAVRNKVNATDLVGPSSRARHVCGPVQGTLYLSFE